MDRLQLATSLAAAAARLDDLVSGGSSKQAIQAELITVKRRFDRFPAQDLPDAIAIPDHKLKFDELWMVTRTIRSRCERLPKLISVGAPDVVIENERRLIKIAVESFPCL